MAFVEHQGLIWPEVTRITDALSTSPTGDAAGTFQKCASLPHSGRKANVKKKKRKREPLTKRQLEASVQQDSMRCWVLGAINLIRLHQDLCVQKEPVP